MGDTDEWQHCWPGSPEAPRSPQDAAWANPDQIDDMRARAQREAQEKYERDLELYWREGE